MSKQGVRLVEVPADQAGRRLDNFLGALLGDAPKSFLYRIIRRGEVRVNGARAKPDRKLVAADVVRVPPMRAGSAGPPPLSEAKLALIRGAIVYEDDAMLVVNKPAGIAVHGGSGLRFGVIDLVRELRPHAPAIELVHRLDRDTSGCLVLAKDYPGLRELQRQLQHPESSKHYAALLDGVLEEASREVALKLATTRRGGEKRTEVAAGGKTAMSRFRLRERFAAMTFVDVEIMTGRTHQIRVHAAAIGHPVAGDKKYGREPGSATRAQIGLKRMFLHAQSIDLRSPAGGPRQRISAPLPQELEECLQRLRRQ